MTDLGLTKFFDGIKNNYFFRNGSHLYKTIFPHIGRNTKQAAIRMREGDPNHLNRKS